jgi:5'-nucleotidase
VGGLTMLQPIKLKKLIFLLVIVAVFFDTAPLLGTSSGVLVLGNQERLITLLGTNDIHGGIESTQTKEGGLSGGMDFWSGAVQSIRAGLKGQFGDRAGVLVLDAGDQFQGTLLSNYSEGRSVFSAMNAVGYDAVVPGNHDYDFGPKGWRNDRVNPKAGDQDPRGAIKKLARIAKFPLLSANTFFRNSIQDVQGNPVEVKAEGCALESSDQGKIINWKKAVRPDFLKPFLVKEIAGVRVALVGLDHPQTPRTTTSENVSDLCFREPLESYFDTYDELIQKEHPDVFVLMIHNGNTRTEFPISQLVQKIISARPGSLHAVISGHTHQYTKWVEQGVPIIQSYNGGNLFGRIDLVWDVNLKTVSTAKQRVFAALPLNHEKCAPFMGSFCKEIYTILNGPKVAYEGVPVVLDPKVVTILQSARKKISKLGNRVLGEATGRITRDRILESPLANILTDGLLQVAQRKKTKADIAFINTGGIREDIAPGTVTYEKFFEVLPMSNHAILLGPLSIQKLFSLLIRSIKTCGAYGALMQSGLRVTYERDCRAVAQDEKAKLLRVELNSGELLIENGAILPSQLGRTFDVATLDFLADGGSGYTDFVGVEKKEDLGVLRERLAKRFMGRPVQFSSEVDGRWKQESPGGAL